MGGSVVVVVCYYVCDPNLFETIVRSAVFIIDRGHITYGEIRLGLTKRMPRSRDSSTV